VRTTRQQESSAATSGRTQAADGRRTKQRTIVLSSEDESSGGEEAKGAKVSACLTPSAAMTDRGIPPGDKPQLKRRQGSEHRVEIEPSQRGERPQGLDLVKARPCRERRRRDGRRRACSA
jgi:hypothetical protein